MRAAWLLLLLAAPDDGRALQFFERTEFLDVRPDSDEARRVLEILKKKEHWVFAYRILEEKYGPFPDALKVRVDFDHQGEEFARGAGQGAMGRVSFNLSRMADYLKNLDKLDLERDRARQAGKIFMFKVPPARFDRMIVHELTHVLQRGYTAPDWFNEGMAEFASEELNTLAGYLVAGGKPEVIDVPLFSRNENYARGHLFWRWLESKGAAKKAVQLSIFDRKPWMVAIEEATGMTWAVIVFNEREWSLNEAQRLRK